MIISDGMYFAASAAATAASATDGALSRAARGGTQVLLDRDACCRCFFAATLAGSG